MIFSRVKTGFSLIELLVYMGCSVLLSGYTAYIVQLFHSSLAQRSCNIESSLDLALTLDQLMNDLGALYSDQTVWKELSSTSLIFNNGSHDISWRYSKQRLLRITGEFCSSTKKWKKRGVTVFLSSLTGFDCTAYYKEDIICAFHCSISRGRSKVASFISLRSA